MKIGQRLKQLVGIAAPKLGMALGGPIGAMAGKMVQGALGVDNEEAAVAALEADPDAYLKLKSAEMEFDKRLAELDIDLERLHAEDRDSARTMAGATSIMPQVGLSALFIVGYFTMMGLFFSESMTVPMDDTFKVLIGVLTASIPQILAFWFGSSIGSKQKTDIMGVKA